MIQTKIHPIKMIQPGRKIMGISAILLPFLSDHTIDWQSLRQHLSRTTAAGIIPAVNMDTGYANLITESERVRVLEETKEVLAGASFVAGAYVADTPGESFNRDAYAKQIETIQHYGGIPIIFQSFGLTQQTSEDVIKAYQQIAELCDQFIAFELGTMFAPFGAIYDLATYEQLMAIPQCIGAKHSSLRRDLEWQRITLRDAKRPDFKVFTGNDLAIDMVMYGSDYLLGISTFAPDLFAKRDALWESEDSQFYELNDLLQYLGFFAFRPPVPAYKHSAAQFLKLRGWINSNTPHEKGERRPESDIPVLQDILQRLSAWEG